MQANTVVGIAKKTTKDSSPLEYLCSLCSLTNFIVSRQMKTKQKKSNSLPCVHSRRAQEKQQQAVASLAACTAHGLTHFFFSSFRIKYSLSSLVWSYKRFRLGRGGREREKVCFYFFPSLGN